MYRLTATLDKIINNKYFYILKDGKKDHEIGYIIRDSKEILINGELFKKESDLYIAIGQPFDFREVKIKKGVKSFGNALRDLNNEFFNGELLPTHVNFDNVLDSLETL